MPKGKTRKTTPTPWGVPPRKRKEKAIKVKARPEI